PVSLLPADQRSSPRPHSSSTPPSMTRPRRPSSTPSSALLASCRATPPDLPSPAGRTHASDGFAKAGPRPSDPDPSTAPRPPLRGLFHARSSPRRPDPMVAMINPFDAGGYSLAEMTQAINILPNVYTRLGQMGLFRFEGVTQRSVVIEQAEGVLNLLPTVPLGGPATVANRDTRSMRSFTVPWIPHDDVITPQDIQGVRGFGVADAADPLATVMERKLTRMRVKHAQTRGYMELNALRGIVKVGAGTILYTNITE